ncbi:MAG TPA: alpha/beta hydrolase [Nocardioidaceae bacterium]|nr:alpha/beta hydrolase [Nocardioidaceae bacterium]
MLHPQAEAALAQWRSGPSVTDAGFDAEGIAAMRRDARAEAAAEPAESVARVEDVDAGGVPARLYRHVAGEHTGVLVFLHGGGFVFGDVDTHDAQSRRLANRTGFAVLAVDYRRPPEHRFPAAPDDVDRALAWLLEHAGDLELDARRVVALGDSAGGNLALVAALRNPDRLAATVLVYPFIDPRTRFDSYRSEDPYALSTAESRWFWEQYADPADLVDPGPDLCPLDSPRLGALPPTLVLVAEHDVLRDEDEELARRIQAAGATAEVTSYPGMIHGFWRHPRLFDAAEESFARTATFLRDHVG